VHRDRDPLLPDELFQALLKRAHGGDADALGELWQAVAPTLLRQADKCLPDRLRSVCNPSDLVSDTYLRFHTKLKTFEGSACGQLEAWLQTILRNLILDRIRVYTAEQIGSQDLPGSGTSPSQGARRAEMQDKVRKCLAELSEDDRLALELVVISDLSHKEAAQLLGIKPDTFGKRFTRALPRLRQRLQIAGVHLEDWGF
jgi:RNA polymerase sigma-70 factor (ECF subfamily)